MIRRLQTFFQLPAEEQLWAVVFVPGSLVASLAVRMSRMNSISARFGVRQATNGLCVLADDEQQRKAWRIGQVMAAVGRNVPWRCVCMEEALCVKWMLDWYRIPSATFLGARLDDRNEKGMKAHAWISVGRSVVAGRSGHQAFQVTAVFTQTEFI